MEDSVNSFETFENGTGNVNRTYVLPAYVFWYVTVSNAIIFIVGVTGNVFVLAVVITNKTMRTHMNILLCSLAVADLFVLLICQTTGMIEFYGKDRWFLGETLCKLIPFFENASLNSSVITMLVISCERFQAICNGVKSSSCFGTLTAGKCIICIWCAASIISFPFVFLTHHEQATFYDGSNVKVCRTKIETPLHQIYVVVLFIVCFLLPLIGLTVIYCFLLRTICVTRRLDERPNRHLKQIIAMILAIVALFYISLFPIKIMTLWIVFESIDSVEKLGLENYTNLMSIARILLNVNSAGNPIIYGLISSKFRVAFKNTFQRCFCLHTDKSNLELQNSRQYTHYTTKFGMCYRFCFKHCCHLRDANAEINDVDV